MAEVFDFAVIGAGIGGLTAANELSGEGKLLVVEKLFRPGGTSYSFKRDGYKFLTGPLGFSHPHFVNSWLEKKEIGKMEFIRKDYQLLGGDTDIILSRPLEYLGKDLEELYPDENVQKAFKELKDIVLKTRGLFVYNGGLFNALENKPVKDDLNEYYLPASQYFSDIVQNEELLRIISGLGLQESDLSTIGAAYMWDVLTETGIWYPQGGLESMIKKIFSPVKDMVGLRSEVKEITTEGDYYKIMTSKRTFLAEKVISNVDANITAQLLSEDLKKDFEGFLGKREEGGSVFTIYIGVEKSKIDMERIRAPHVLYYPYLDEQNDLRGNRFYQNEVEVSFISHYDQAAPESGEAIMIRSPFKYDDCKFETREDYYRFKERTANELLEIVEPLIPNLNSTASILDSSTPLTYEVWGGRYRGSVPGWDWTDNISSCMINPPLDNFYLCGIYSFSIPFLGAFPTSMYSGKLAAQFVKGNSLF